MIWYYNILYFASEEICMPPCLGGTQRIYYSILYQQHTIQYYTILYYTTLYYTLLYLTTIYKATLHLYSIIICSKENVHPHIFKLYLVRNMLRSPPQISWSISLWFQSSLTFCKAHLITNMLRSLPQIFWSSCLWFQGHPISNIFQSLLD